MNVRIEKVKSYSEHVRNSVAKHQFCRQIGLISCLTKYYSFISRLFSSVNDINVKAGKGEAKA